MSDESAARDESAAPSTSTAQAPFVFLLGVLLFLVSLAAFVADLVTGHGVVRSLAANAVGVAVLVVWAAYDTLSDPESAVASRDGATGTALLLYGLYLFVAAIVVAVTSLVHGRTEIALYGAGVGAVFVIVGFVIYPRDTIVESVERTEDDGSDDGSDSDSDSRADGEAGSDDEDGSGADEASGTDDPVSDE